MHTDSDVESHTYHNGTREITVTTTYDGGHAFTEREWKCNCGRTVYTSRGSDADCDCGRCYNTSGQELRSDWRGNSSNWDDEVSDLEGYELQHSPNF